jgi:hypothetical protein
MRKNIIFIVILTIYLLFSVHSAIAASAARETDSRLNNNDTWLQRSPGANGGGIGDGETPTGDQPTVGGHVGTLPAACLLLLTGAYIVFKKRKQTLSKTTC